MRYCTSTFRTERWKTREVMVGNIAVGGSHPIRIQSMTSSKTRDVEATVEQIMRLSDVGCEIARVTVQGKKEAEACEHIKNQLLQAGYTIPVVADIHFYPPAAMLVIDFVDKVRINPGNYLDKRACFKVLEYTDETYAQELERVEENFAPLVLKSKELGRAMRIGTNHGSLSDRIMSRYGDTPAGMVASAIEYAEVCRKYDFHDFMFSMKSSNPQIMIQAYRLLVAKMIELGWDYPLHLGVTEAGEGEDGRIKSAIGIGALLVDGLGDTIRVSLTEDPWHEINPCRRLVAFAEGCQGRGVEPYKKINECDKKSPVAAPESIPFHRDSSVGLCVTAEDLAAEDFLKTLGCKPSSKRWAKDIATVDFIKVLSTSSTISTLQELNIGVLPNDPSIAVIEDEAEAQWEVLKETKPTLVLLRPKKSGRVQYARKFFNWCRGWECDVPIILNFVYDGDWEDIILQASAECGALLCDGFGEGLMLEGPYALVSLRELSFSILQGCRKRTVKTEFISCPSCGRTLFNLQEVSARIRKLTGHLPGVKIAIMGCIVNGPGEMADADFGYVGSKPGKVDLYVGKTCVERGIDHTEADIRLVELIKAHGCWMEPKEHTEVLR